MDAGDVDAISVPCSGLHPLHESIAVKMDLTVYALPVWLGTDAGRDELHVSAASPSTRLGEAG